MWPLHLAKYLGALSQDSDSDAYRRVFVDSFIMIASASNILALRMSDWIEGLNPDCSELKSSEYTQQYISALSSLAKACDATDHIENFPMNVTWKNSIVEFLRLTISRAYATEVQLISEAITRLDSIESEHGLHFILSKRK